MKTISAPTKMQLHAARQRAMRVPGYFIINEDGTEAHVWTQTAWCAQVCLQRQDMSHDQFQAFVKQVAALAAKSK